MPKINKIIKTLMVLVLAMNCWPSYAVNSSTRFLKVKTENYNLIEFVDGIDSSLSLSLHKKDFNIKLGGNDSKIRLIMNAAPLARLGSFPQSYKVEAYVYDGDEKRLISIVTPTIVDQVKAKNSFFLVDLSTVEESQEIFFDIHNTSGDLVATFKEFIEIDDSSVTSVGTPVNIESADCADPTFGECQIKHFFDNVKIQAIPSKVPVTTVQKETDGKYTVSIPVMRKRSKAKRFVGNSLGSASITNNNDDIVENLNIGIDSTNKATLTYNDIKNSLDLHLVGHEGKAFSVNKDGKVTVGSKDPKAFLDVRAGTNGTPSIKIRKGVLTVSPQNGSLEYDGNDIFFTIAGVRKSLTAPINGLTTGSMINDAQLSEEVVMRDKKQSMSNKTISAITLMNPIKIPEGAGAGKILTASGSNGAIAWQPQSVAAPSLWKVSSNIISNNGDSTDYQDDFVVGSSSLDDASDSNMDNRLFFDKSKAAFRAGASTGTEWDDSSRGTYSIAMGYNTIANSNYSIAIGDTTSALDADALAIGKFLTSNGEDAWTLGRGLSTSDKLSNSDNKSLAIGFNSNAATLFIGTSTGGSNTANVGIGTSSPTAKLEIAGQIKITGGSPQANYVLTTDATGLASWQSANSGLLNGALLVANNLSDLNNAATARTNLGVAIGTNVQAWDADLDAFALETAPSGVVVGTTDTQTLTNKTLTAPTINVGLINGTTINGATFNSPSFVSADLVTPSLNGAVALANANSHIQAGRLNGTTLFKNNSTAQFNGTVMIPGGAVANYVLSSDANGVASWKSVNTTLLNGALLAASNLSDLANVATARTNLGLVIGTNVQAYSANLDLLAAKVVPSGNLVGTTQGQTLSNKTLEAAVLNGTNLFKTNSTAKFNGSIMITNGATNNYVLASDASGNATWKSANSSILNGALLVASNLSDLANAATSRTNLGVAIGSDVQAWDSDLDAFALKTAPTGVVVGTTDTQTLTNKTLTTPTINVGLVNGSTINGATINSATIQVGLVNGSTINGATLNSATINSATFNSPNLITPSLNGVVALANAATQVEAAKFNGTTLFKNNSTAQFNGGILIPTGATNNYVLSSDASGNATWKSVNSSLINGALLAASNLSDLANAATSRTNLGVAIGTNVQAWDTDLDTWATKTAPSGAAVGTTDTQTLTNKTLTAPTINVGLVNGSTINGTTINTATLVSPTLNGANLIEYLYHASDTDTSIRYQDDSVEINVGGEVLMNLVEAGQDIVEIGDDGDVDIKLSANGDGVLFAEGSSGNIGIGTSSPAAQLHIDSDGIDETNNAEVLMTSQSDVNWIFGIDNGNTSAFTIANGSDLNTDTHLTIQKDGNVGIGKNNPSSVLDVAGTAIVTGFKLPTGASNTFVLTSDAGGNGTWAAAGGGGGGATNVDGLSDAASDATSIFVGNGSGASDDGTANENTALGIEALNKLTTGAKNVAVGHRAMFSSVGGSDSNVAVGHYSMYYANSSTADKNVAVGMGSLFYLSSGSFNTGVGNQALYDVTTAIYNTGVGSSALENVTTGSYNAACGAQSLWTMTTAANNSALGYRALFGTTTGGNNIAIGYQAGDEITSGTNNIIIGHDNDAASNTGSYQIDIGDVYYGNGSSSFAGIGTASPQAQFHIDSDGVSTNNAEILMTAQSNVDWIFGIDNGDSSKFKISNGSNLVTDTAITIQKNGNVGIGTASPSEELEVNGDIKIGQTLVFDEVVDNGSAANVTINWTTGNRQKLTMDQNITFTFTEPSGPAHLTLVLIQDATGSRTATWPSEVKWAGGSAPTLTTTASQLDIITCFYMVNSGNKYYCQAGLNFAP